MIPQKARKVLYWFLFAYAVFALIIVYLFLFNSGLEITEEFNELKGTKDIYIYNNSDHPINNVSIKYLLNKEDKLENDLNTFYLLEAKQKKLLNLDNISANTIILLATSQFHMTIEKTIVLQRKENTSIKINFPDEIKFGKSFPFSIELCNKTNQKEDFKITEEHEVGFFSEPNKTETTSIQPEECKKISYSLLPTEKGETVIYFKIKSANTNEEFEQKINVE